MRLRVLETGKLSMIKGLRPLFLRLYIALFWNFSKNKKRKNFQTLLTLLTLFQTLIERGFDRPHYCPHHCFMV